jgi:hypothetical protein
MARGTAQVNYVGEGGEAYRTGLPSGSWDFIYEKSTTKDARWNIGDRVVLPDGRVFRYCKSGAACYPGQGNVFYNAIPATGIDYSLLYEAAALGARSIKMTNQGTVAQTLDGLRGGEIILKPASGSGNDELQMRGIIGNTAGGVSDVITIYLDAPLTEALTTASYAFCMPSPYSDIRQTGGTAGCVSFAGVAAIEITASGYYFWLQTKGLCWIAPQSGVGATTYYRTAYWRHDGSVDIHPNIGTNVTDQIAGVIIDNNSAANGSTLISLQCDY